MLLVSVPTAFPGGPVQGTHVCSLPLFLEGQPVTQKGCVGVGVWEVSRATSWSQLAAPTLHTPLRGAEPPSPLRTTLGGLPGAASSCCLC